MNQSKTNITVFWFRRDLRLEDNTALYHALKSGFPVLPVFVFDSSILDALEDKDDARVSFIYTRLKSLNEQLQEKHESSLWIFHGRVEHAWQKLSTDFDIQKVFYNRDYEPHARQRDAHIGELLREQGIEVHSYKDQVVFEMNEVLKDDGLPYTVYTPYKNKWLSRLHQAAYPLQARSIAKENGFLKIQLPFLPLQDIGFVPSSISMPKIDYMHVVDDYGKTRDFPSLDQGTSHLGIHLRFGTISIRQVVADALESKDPTWLHELIWREFFMMVIYHFPYTVEKCFRKEYERIVWRNDVHDFDLWCRGQTGYPLVDAGMHELNRTGYMHNRVRMVVASFLCKHLLIDWRWGEAYFARKLLDYEQSSNVGNWQWAAGCGTDAAPYFRVFNPILQAKKFDPEGKYIKKWVPDFTDPFRYPAPIVAHEKARNRALETYKNALKT